MMMAAAGPRAAAPVCHLPAPAGTLHLRLANDINAVAAALPDLQAFAKAHQLPARVANRLEVVFEELVSNPIRHGFWPGSDQVLHVRIGRRDDRLRLEIEDDGIAFDPLARAVPAPLDDLDSAPEGGLGIALVKKLASHFVCEAPQLPGMVNRLVVELPVARSAPQPRRKVATR
jgi:anti-sigma regulatory factor (Ser/Thr protein kinase)